MDTVAMTESLQFGERDDQVFAAREVCKLNSKQKLKLAENGIIFPLVSMIQSQDYESIEAALYALLHLAFGCERNKVSIVKSRSIPALLKVLLEWRSESLLELALALLLILSSCTANRPEIASSGAVQVLFRLLGSENIHRAKFDIISTLHNLSVSVQIDLSDGLISLIRLIHASEKSSDIVEKAINLLESLVSSSDTTLNQVSEVEGVMGMLVEAVEDGTTACKEHAVAILVRICKSSRERYRGMILSEGAMPGLLQLSVHGNRRAREKAKALLMLLRDDGGSSSSSSSSSRVKHAKSVLFQEVMRRIDRAGSSIEMVEEMIAKLRT